MNTKSDVDITDHPVHEEHDEDEGEDEGEEETAVAEQAEPLAFPEDGHLGVGVDADADDDVDADDQEHLHSPIEMCL